MMDLPLPFAQDVVLVGGGHTHALVLRNWGMDPVPGARLTLIDPGPTAPYTGMLPGFVAGHYGRDELDIDLVKLARYAGARLILGRVDGIDLQARTLSVAGRPPIRFDIASIDIGITSHMSEIDGFAGHAVPAKPLGRFADRWAAFRDDGGGDVAVIGGGVAGVELALAMRHSLRQAGGAGRMTVIEADTLLSGVGDSTRDRLIDALREFDIDTVEGARVDAVAQDAVHLSDGTHIPANLTIGAAGARPYDWVADTGLKLTDGFITVDRNLVSSDPAIFAAGDCAHLSHAPRPKAGVYAVRAAPVLAANLRARLTDGEMEAYRPQKHYLKLISLGGKRALAEKYGRSVGGDWAWRWKDRIDRAFMDRVNDPPAMDTAPDLSDAATGVREALGPKPLCGGCGAKVGPSVLHGALAGLTTRRDDIEAGVGDDAAILRVGGTRMALTVDTLRALWPDPFVMARLATLHALGDVWSMGAAPQAALVQIGLPRMAETMQAAWLAEIMSATRGVLEAEGAEIVGGHTTIGAELTIGLTVTGLNPMAFVGPQEGDRLLLTRPLGCGVLFAAEMERKANGDHIAALLDRLSRSQGDAARVLTGVATAMTDVTGFGLAGHLSRLVSTARVGAELDLSAIPTYHGALDLAANGVRSSIWAANAAAVAATLPSDARADLLFDPQTCGGLLASLPKDKAEATLAEIRAMGHDAALIGTVISDTGGRITAR